ncbi:MAG: Oxygen sensor histidine kinase NreB [Syntrophorhabdaceae bacterium PtaU1.Bin034]|nr:MAG: Oxygen sensor histidine kinase NreB [Syntrophorhabdaceae bacterium PtaU1.Bin034]
MMAIRARLDGTRPWLRILWSLVLVFTIPIVLPGNSSATQLSKKRVLVLHSYYQGYKWTDDENAGIESVLKPVVGRNNLHIEYMDTKKVFGDLYSQRLYEVYKLKYRNYKFDLIIVTDNNALDFMRKYRDRLFPGTPVVFCGVNYFHESQLKGHRLFTGVNEENDLKGCIELVLRIHPHTRQIVFINEWTRTGQAVHDGFIETMPYFQKSVRFLLLEDVKVEEILKELDTLPPDSVVLYSAFSRDKQGRIFDFNEIGALVARYSKVPVYTTNDFNLGLGVVGGLVVHGYGQGETAGRMALRILEGERIENIPVVMTSPKRYIFDYAQMQRFNIATEKLPRDSVIINLPQTFYFKYRNWIYIVAVTIAFLLLVISVLLVSIRRRKQTERELEASREQLRSLGREASEIEEKGRKTLSTELHDQIGQNMTILGVNLNILRSLIPRNEPNVVDPIDARINDSMSIVKQTTERIRNLMTDLRSPVLDDYGLAAAIDHYGKQCAQRAGISINVQGNNGDVRFSPSVENTVFRIVQEALTNVVKHSHATQVDIKVGVKGKRLEVRVSDNGVGYDPEKIGGRDGKRGWGLITMKERALAIGGKCLVESSPGWGTHVTIEVLI